MITNTIDGKKTNKEMVDNMYLTLCALRDGKGAKNQKEKDEMYSNYLTIVHNSQDEKLIMEWLEQIYNEKDELRAQELIKKTLIPLL